MVNGLMSVKKDVTSGVPQELVLSSIFFIIMISYLNENVRNSISRLDTENRK